MVDAVTLITDFGDYYQGVMKGVILKIAPDARIVDITHNIEPQNIYQGAFLLFNSYRFFPPSVHVAVVDPGVGGNRRAIAVECKSHVFIGPDNGILYPACSEAGIKRIWRIDEEKMFRFASSSTTFHGRDVFAPAAALVFTGKLEEVGEEIDGMHILELFDYSIEKSAIRARIMYVDRFGNAVTNIPGDAVQDAKAFYVNGIEFPLVETYSCVEVGKPLALIGSFNTLELSIRSGSASELFGLKSGEVVLEWRK